MSSEPRRGISSPTRSGSMPGSLSCSAIIQQEKRGQRTIVTDTRVGDYRDIDGLPIAHEFVSTRDGKPYFSEQYEDVQVNAALPAGIFDPLEWSSVRPRATIRA